MSCYQGIIACLNRGNDDDDNMVYSYRLAALDEKNFLSQYQKFEIRYESRKLILVTSVSITAERICVLCVLALFILCFFNRIVKPS